MLDGQAPYVQVVADCGDDIMLVLVSKVDTPSTLRS